MGPICVASHLAPFLMGHPVVACGGTQAIGPVSAAPFGSALVTLISYGYIKMLGGEGLTNSTKMAILNANYMKFRLEAAYPIFYTGEHGRAAHEMILDCRPLKRDTGIEVTDIAKVMLARQEAGIAFEATLQVRNKLLSAYQDIMRMGV